MTYLQSIIKLANAFDNRFKKASTPMFQFEEDEEPEIREEIDTEDPEIPSPTLAHNDYLIEVFYQLFFPVSIFVSQMNDFVEANKDKINQLRRFFQYQQPIYLGKGSDGVAFDIGNGLVLKFFIDPYQVTKVQEAMDRLYQPGSISKTEAMIYDVGTLGDTINNCPIYYLIMEKMTPMNEIVNNRPLFNSLREIYEHIGMEVEYLFRSEVWGEGGLSERNEALKEKLLHHLPRIITTVQNLSGNRIEKVNQQIREGKINLREDWLPRFVEEVFDKVCTRRGDLHLGNLGVTSYGTLCFFDPAHRSWQTRMNYFSNYAS